MPVSTTAVHTRFNPFMNRPHATAVARRPRAICDIEHPRWLWNGSQVLRPPLDGGADPSTVWRRRADAICRPVEAMNVGERCGIFLAQVMADVRNDAMLGRPESVSR